MTATEERKMRDFRAVFDLLHEDPRMKYQEIARILDLDIRVASSRLKEATEKEYIVGPQIRKKSFSNLKTYVNFIDCDDPLEMYQRCLEDENVIYHALLDGFCNLQVLSENPMNIGGSVLKGVLPDYVLSRPPDRPWKMAIDIMQKMARNFSPADYVSKGYIKNHWNEAVDWSDEYEILYREFKYDLRKPIMHVVNKHNMWRGKAYDFLRELPHYCTILTCYYPGSLVVYNECLYAFETDYEDFIIDLFSQLPTTSCFYKVDGKLIAHLQITIRPLRWKSTPIQKVSELQVPFMIKDLVKRRILKSEAHAVFRYHWRKEADDIRLEAEDL